MKTFLVKNKKPMVQWSKIADNTFFKGEIPKGYDLAVCPSKGVIIIDVDIHPDKNKNGFKHIPKELLSELNNTLNYKTKNQGKHYWFKYTGIKNLGNKTSNKGIDLRTHKGYVVFYPKYDIKDQMSKIKNSSPKLNKWLEKLFSCV